MLPAETHKKRRYWSDKERLFASGKRIKWQQKQKLPPTPPDLQTGCVVCGQPTGKRAGALTCSVAHRKALERWRSEYKKQYVTLTAVV